jgi:hypothetical protein
MEEGSRSFMPRLKIEPSGVTRKVLADIASHSSVTSLPSSALPCRLATTGCLGAEAGSDWRGHLESTACFWQSSVACNKTPALP